LRLFGDGVFAIALTLLIIDIKIPASEGIGTTRELWLALGHLGPFDRCVRVEFCHHLRRRAGVQRR
jgi:hypothetical protein